MTITYWCILVISLLPYIWVVFAKSGKDYSNKAPRLYTATLTGWKQRAYWAHLNAFEAMPGIIAALFIAQFRHVPQFMIDRFALVFVFCRILHGLFYMTNQATLRSAAWLGGFTCMIALFVLSA